MNKYDFGYELQEGTTNYWAYEIIEEGSKVLEIGSSVGLLTKNLKTKNCIVDIIEIDNEAGMKAAEFARKVCIGDIDGNIENDAWVNNLIGETYDFIVLLDVLEHLYNPQRVLKCLKQFLNEYGKIILSVPNIAHNSVLINLLNNKFVYTDVGLLDDTHIHFFTFESLKQMVKETGYTFLKQECIRKSVGENEINNSYFNVSPDIISYFKMRGGNTGEIYQFLVVLADEKEEIMEENSSWNSISPWNSPYYLKVYREHELFFSQPVDTNKIYGSIPINGKGLYRIDPINNKCILEDVEIIGMGKNIKTHLHFGDTNAIFLKYSMLFAEKDPQIYVEINSEEYDLLIFKANILLLEHPLIERISNSIDNAMLKKINISNDYFQIYYGITSSLYSEENCINTRLLDPHKICKKIKLNGREIRIIRIDPMNISCELRIIEIAIKCIGMSSQKIRKYKSNANKITNNIYTFLHDDPQLIIDLGKCRQVEYIEVYADIIKTDIVSG